MSELDNDGFERSPEAKPMRRYTSNAFHSAVTFVHTCDPASTQRRHLMAYPQCLFRGEGLWLWGASSATLIHEIRVGNQLCFSISTVPIPGLYFEAGMSFKEFESLCEKSGEGWTHERLRSVPQLPSHQRIRMMTAEIGNNIVLDVEGPLTHAVTWGTTVL